MYTVLSIKLLEPLHSKQLTRNLLQILKVRIVNVNIVRINFWMYILMVSFCVYIMLILNLIRYTSNHFTIY